MRRPDFLKKAAAPGCGRRDGTGAPPPASRVLRIALARGGLRPPLTPETSGAPQGQQSGQPKGLPRSARGALPARAAPAAGGLTPGTTMEGAWTTTANHRTQAYTCSIKQAARKITRLTGGQPQS